MSRKLYQTFTAAQWPAVAQRLGLRQAETFRDVTLAPGDQCYRTPAGLRFVLSPSPGGYNLDNVCVC